MALRKNAIILQTQQNVRGARFRRIRNFILVWLAVGAFGLLAIQDIAMGLLRQNNAVDEREELSNGAMNKKVVWKSEWLQTQHVEKQLMWRPKWKKIKISVSNIEEIQKWTVEQIRGWKVIRRPSWINVKVPMWTDFEVPELRKMLFPVISERKILKAKEVLVPAWVQTYIPAWVKDNIPGEINLGTDEYGWEYIVYDIWRRKLVWIPIWRKSWTRALREEWLTERNIEWREKYCYFVTTRSQPIWIVEQHENWIDETIPFITNILKKKVVPVEKKIWVDTWKLFFEPAWKTKESISLKKVWKVVLEKAEKEAKQNRAWF